jgi:guanosine-3',5'-bis(diphosphate) 3'-pyrophosphohydrolase
MTLEDSLNELGAAFQIAPLAHRGQTRADGVTPYIFHPMRVEQLVAFWGAKDLDLLPWEPRTEELLRMRAAALMHDVVEDTTYSLETLDGFGFSHELLDLVDLLTKPDNGPAGPDYYKRIATSREALVVKCADRCTNLEDAIKSVKAGDGIERWRAYAEKTERDVLPLYEEIEWSDLHWELVERLTFLNYALDAVSRVRL